MAGIPPKPSEDDEFDLDIDLDDLDDAALQRLLEEDPALEKELEALEASDLSAPEPAETEVEPEGDVDDSIVETAPSVDDDEDDGSVDDDLAALLEQDDAGEFDDALDHEESDDDGLMALPSYADDDDADALSDDPPFVAAPSHDDLADFSVDHEEEEHAPEPPVAEPAPALSEEEVAALNLPPVPRINISAFCVTDQMTSLIEQAAADRRLSKAHVTIQSGDATRAAEVFSDEPTPNLLIIEAGSSMAELLSGLDQLAQVCDPSTRVVIVGNINDIRLYRELMDRGISEYLVTPRSPLQLISIVGELYADPSAPPIGKSFVFVGARGGTGSSTICHNVAWMMADDFSTDTILVDLDLPFGTAGLDFEQDPSQGLSEALAAPDRLDDVLLDRLLQKCSDRLSLFAAPNALERDYDLAAENFEQVLDTVRHAAPGVVIDLPHLWSGWAKTVLQSADEIVLTAAPDLASFRNAKNIIETIRTHRTNDSPPILVINQSGVPKRPEVPMEQFEEALGIAPKAIVPWDPVLFATASTNADAIGDVAPKSKSAQELRRIASMLLGRPEPSARGLKFDLKSLFSKGR